MYGIDERDQRMLHKFLFEHVEKLGKCLSDRTSKANELSTSGAGADRDSFLSGDAQWRRSHEAKNVYDDLCDALATAGEPRQTNFRTGFRCEQLSGLPSSARRSHVDEDSYRTIFYEGPSSRAGRPVLYYAMHNQKADTIDFEGLILYILQTLETFAYRQFDLVFNTTACHPST